MAGTGVLEDLRKIRILAGLDDRALQRIAAYLESHDLPPGEPVIREEVPAGRCFFLVAGSVRVGSSMSDVDQEEVYSFLHEGDHFGEISLIDRRPPAASVVAEERCRLYSIGHDELRRLLKDEPALGNSILWSMLESFCARLRETNQSLSFARFLMKRSDLAR